ncbi:MAG: hypothetical protein U9Q30_08925 [Campylobacterota bacterium]|nr:hypothetical protein [Campylobacterota bacterium]
MKTITLEIEDNNYKAFLNIIDNLKDGFIKNYSVNEKDNYQKEKILKDLQNGILDIKKGNTYPIDTLWDKLDD